jgi:hypothetical protein
VNAELFKTFRIGSQSCWQNQSLKADELLKFFRRETTDKIIPTRPEDKAINFYQTAILDTNQYVCLGQGDDINIFWSWLWVTSKEEGLKTVGSWDIPKQNYNSESIYVPTLCISRKYRNKINWLKYVKDLLPTHKELFFKRAK